MTVPVALSPSQFRPQEKTTSPSHDSLDTSLTGPLPLSQSKESTGTEAAAKTGDSERPSQGLALSSKHRPSVSLSKYSELKESEQRRVEPFAISTSKATPKSGGAVVAERPPHLPSKERSPPLRPRASKSSINERDSDSSVGRIRSPLLRGDSYRPDYPKPPGYRTKTDCYRPSPPASEPSRPNVNVQSNSSTPRARAAAPPLRPEIQATSAQERSSPPSHRHHSQNKHILDAEAQIARMPTGVPIPGQSTHTTEGYFWNWGEVLAHVYFGPERKFIGPVRICGMSDEAKGDLLGSKPRGSEKRKFEVWFRDLCTVEEYEQLCDKVGMQTFVWQCNTNSWSN